MNMNDLNSLRVIRRDGEVVPFDESRIRNALTNAFLKDAAGQPRRHGNFALSASEWKKVNWFTDEIAASLFCRYRESAAINVEAIQDQVELMLMRAGEHDIARDYVLFREHRAADRDFSDAAASAFRNITMLDKGERVLVTLPFVEELVMDLCTDIPDITSTPIVQQVMRDIYDEIPREKLDEAILLAARTMIEKDPGYDRVTVRHFLKMIRREAIGVTPSEADMRILYPVQLVDMVEEGITAGRLDPRLEEFDLERLGKALHPERDLKFRYLGLQTLYDRYFIQHNGRRIELPQTFFMRIAMGLALNEPDRNSKAIEFYELLSSFRYMCSTPTLFNSGTVVPQLSSCYLTTVADDLEGIYQSVKENALLQKYAGGLGNDWTRVRALGSWIRGTNGKSQGVIPFLKVVNDTAVAVNQGGRRRGAVCCYLETWHLDIEEFLELRRNVGDDRRRTHDMNTANWVPDLFMKRVMEDGEWTLFSPEDVPDLHETHGKAFEELYQIYEARALAGKIKRFKKVSAVALWRKMLSMLFETGHPWICFKDPCNIRSPQQHVGVVHGSNLCTEITLNTSDAEIAVCNLGSVNLMVHLSWSEERQALEIDHRKLQDTVRIAVRMLDNVIDLNYYAVEKARQSNLQHRPIGLGMMGLQDCLYQSRIPFASQEAVEFSSMVTEALSYYAYWASTDLAEERGRYSSYSGSLWEWGVLPIDSVELLKRSRGSYFDVTVAPTMPWDSLRERIAVVGMRNSNCVAIAPTATISNIVGVSPSIEPAYQNLFVKSNLSGEFTVVNEYLVDDLKKRGLWDDVMVADLKYFDGSVQAIDRIPDELKQLYATAFDINAKWLIEAAGRRQVWIDQAQSLNLFFKTASGKMLDEAYKLAWVRGLKTTYYLRSLGATSAEKSTMQAGSLNAVDSSTPNRTCALHDTSCESCQ